MGASTSVLWLRRDLRRRDHPALLAARDAAADGDLVVAFVVDPRLWAGGGAARRAWLAATLEATNEAFDGALTLLQGDPRNVVPELAARVGASSVHVSRETTPAGRRRDDAVAARLRENGVEWVETGTPYAVGPGLVVNGSGGPYKVFTPFSKAWRAHGWPDPAPTPRELPLRHPRNDADATAAVKAALAAPGLPALPPAGEEAALKRWRAFRDGAVTTYTDDRNRPDLDGTSRLSPYLKLGVLHPRTLLADLAGERGKGAQTFENELAWREFYADVLWHQPRTAWHDLRPEMSRMRYDEPEDAIDAWRTGHTGYPVVDAGMRQLLAQGWMHNRVRMITASFLTKDLHVWWPVGARHFLEHLIDGDIASNNHGWQWVAGTGTDASPYFRVFNPVTQGLRFDPDGAYVRRWVPELAHLVGVAAHEPWEAPDGYAHGYPRRIVDHAAERLEALSRLEATKR
ncbi:MAG TPA: deoxyribodipyrimidine photo-lyase [Ornithinibacter sp.]|nr:deoxyribodipyrimidine photo-lyase [Ornithinibacter sp.]